MNLLIALVAVIAFSFLFRGPLKAHPGIFYAIACLFVVLFIFSSFSTVPPFVKTVSFVLMQKATVSVAFFVVVMYIGALPRQWAVRRMLMPIRAELSILACIFCAGHIAVYLATYVPATINGIGTASTAVTLALVVALVLFVLILVLGVTSFRAVKKRMSAKTWKIIQRWAYVFYGFIYVHLMLMLAPAALRGGAAAITSAIVYTIIFGGYAVARIARYVIDKRAMEKVDLGDNEFADTPKE